MGNRTMIRVLKTPAIAAGRPDGTVGLSGHDADGFDSLRYAAEQGDADAQFALAEILYKKYDECDGGEKELAEAVRWYQAAAGQGDARAQFEIGWCYLSGKGVEEAPEKAVGWYRLAAEQGYAAAQYWLGWCHQYGKGVEVDLAEAVKWYRTAAAQGNADALEDLADLGCEVSGYGMTI